MNILVNLSNYLFCQAIENLLVNEKDKKKKKQYTVECSLTYKNENFVPDIILTDFYSLDKKLLSIYPDAKVILIDTGLEQEVIASLMFSFNIDGLLSCTTDVCLLKKALDAVSKGEIWLDNRNVKALLHKEGLVPEEYKMKAVTTREQEVIDYVSMGLSNKEIASKLCLSEQTVKAHLNRIFKRFNVVSRSKLAAIVLNTKKY